MTVGASVCDVCGERSTHVEETRQTDAGAKRRRYKCKGCGAIVTKYEVSKEFYRRALNMDRCFKQLLQLERSNSESVGEKDCKVCANYLPSRGCIYEFPEAETEIGFAAICNHFTSFST